MPDPGFRVDLGLLVTWNHNTQTPHVIDTLSTLRWWNKAEYDLLTLWVQEVHAHVGSHDLNVTLHNAVLNPAEFAKQLRHLGWHVYYYEDKHGLYAKDGKLQTADLGSYHNYGKRWGLIVAPYCDRLLMWRLIK